MQIVIVEDEIRIREGLNNLIKKFYPNHTVAAMADNGKNGLECIRKIRPDLVFTDIRMPVMDGLQMLEQMRSEGIQAKAVILSAYTEFDYAQKAMRLGVIDYLIKPVVIADFMRIMKHVEELEKEQKEAPKNVTNLSHQFSALLYGTLNYDRDIENYLFDKFKISQTDKLILLNCYLGSQYKEGLQTAKKELRFWFFEKHLEYELIEMEQENSLVAVIYRHDGAEEFERWFQNQILLDEREKSRSIISFGIVVSDGPGKLRISYENILKYMDWHIVLGERILISYPKILHIQNTFCVYPVDLESAMKAAICAYEREKMRKVMEQFFTYFKNGKVYDPKEIKECVVRFLWSMMSVAKEIKRDVLDTVKQQKVLEQIMSANSISELEAVGLKLLGQMQKDDDVPSLSLSVMRAKNLVAEFYHTGITLEEIAQKLNMTAEYLGTMFRKETGRNFSTYIRDYRIAKAKELLIGTTYRQHEIAELVGYSDAKYFSRVFKEVVGLSPVEYRRSNK